MSIKEHLQFFAMMIPTLLLLLAAVISLAAPIPSMGASQPTGVDSTAAIVVDTEAGPHAVAVR